MLRLGFWFGVCCTFRFGAGTCRFSCSWLELKVAPWLQLPWKKDLISGGISFTLATAFYTWRPLCLFWAVSSLFICNWFAFLKMVSGNLFHCRKNSWPPEEYISKSTLQLVSLSVFFDIVKIFLLCTVSLKTVTNIC